MLLGLLLHRQAEQQPTAIVVTFGNTRNESVKKWQTFQTTDDTLCNFDGFHLSKNRKINLGIFWQQFFMCGIILDQISHRGTVPLQPICC